MEVTILGKTLAEVSDYFTNTCCIIGKKPRHPGQQKEIEIKICYLVNLKKNIFFRKRKEWKWGHGFRSQPGPES